MQMVTIRGRETEGGEEVRARRENVCKCVCMYVHVSENECVCVGVLLR